MFRVDFSNSQLVLPVQNWKHNVDIHLPAKHVADMRHKSHVQNEGKQRARSSEARCSRRTAVFALHRDTGKRVGSMVAPRWLLAGRPMSIPWPLKQVRSATMCRPKFDQLTDDRRLFPQKKEELTMRPVLPWNVPMRGGCAQPHSVPRIQTGPNPFPQRLVPQLWDHAWALWATDLETSIPQKPRANSQP